MRFIDEKKCVMICGGGGVGKTTIAASLGLVAVQKHARVLVVTIDPSKRLAEAFGFQERELIDGGEPLVLSPEVKAKLGVPEAHELSVGILNPRYVLEQILEQTLTAEQAERLKKTLIYAHMSEMIYGLQEYTAYEWVTRMIRKGEYDFIVLDTPPSYHAKDFFNVPERVKNLMESRVFQLFMPKKSSWFSGKLSLSWLEKLLGERVYQESRTFFEIFTLLRERILERCGWLAEFFTDETVGVVAVSTTEGSGQFELEGFYEFLKGRGIALEGIILNQIEVEPEPLPELELSQALVQKLEVLQKNQRQKAAQAARVVTQVAGKYSEVPVFTVPMAYAEDGFDILKNSAETLAKTSDVNQ